MNVYTHKIDYLSPCTIAKLEAGTVLGHSSDDGLTTDSENWVINYSKGTEVVIFSANLFEDMWRQMNLNSEKQRLIHYLSYCPLLSCLSTQTLSNLIYDSATIIEFDPGQHICLMSKKSAINKDFSEFNKEVTTTAMSNAVANEHYKKTSEEEHGILVEVVKQMN
jgi:hypothetical protein